MSNTALRLTYYNIADGVCAFSTTRHGGTSEGNHASLNINPYCGDKPEHVAANRALLAEELGVDADRIILPHQTHGTETHIIGKEFCTQPEQIRQMLLEGVDALLTDVKGVCIGVSTADCIPVLLYITTKLKKNTPGVDLSNHPARYALVELENIHDPAQVFEPIHRVIFKTDPKKLKAVIGPGISRKNFEVGDEVYAAFEEAAFDMPTLAQQEIKRNPDAADPSKLFEKKWHIDLKLANRQLLEHAGVADENILESDVCTYDSVDESFSAQRLGAESGRIYSGIIL